MTLPEIIQAVQKEVGVKVDGKPGSKTWNAIHERIFNPPATATVETSGTRVDHSGKASSFADPADIEGFKKAKARGLNDKEAFAFGDNGIGCWGDDTTNVTLPYVAVTPDDMIAQWGSIAAAKHKHVAVTIGDKTVNCIVADRMPWKKNVTNGAIIDLAPGAQHFFELEPPFLVDCSWSWV